MPNIKRVLVVDDEEDLTWSISKNLARDKNIYELICVNSGVEALEVLDKVPVDLVITDIRMPEIGGIELLIQIKERFTKTKVIIMTAYGSEDIQREVFRKGSIAYIEKPFEINKLRDLILKNIQEQKGFVGQVSDFQLSDIIQMNALGRLTTALQVVNGSEVGTVFFIDGHVVHAEVPGKEGEEAFYQIINWEGGEFSSKRGLKPPKESISKSVQSLLLEGLKRVDEDTEENEEDKNRLYLSEMLNRLVSRKYVYSVALILTGEEPIALTADNLDSEHELALNVVDFASIQATAIKEMNSNGIMGSNRLATIEYSDYVLHLYFDDDKDAVFVAFSDAKVNVGALRMEMRKIFPEMLQLI
jgi:CheY-like chemotaxis protein/predicted regulator of Ras-like GTPase activity (Roadblock/LC7/MglB family)